MGEINSFIESIFINRKPYNHCLNLIQHWSLFHFKEANLEDSSKQQIACYSGKLLNIQIEPRINEVTYMVSFFLLDTKTHCKIKELNVLSSIILFVSFHSMYLFSRLIIWYHLTNWCDLQQKRVISSIIKIEKIVYMYLGIYI